MAQIAERLPENIEGPFFVDRSCIDCDTCRQIAPDSFGETGDFSFVKCQPEGESQVRAALRALVACPTGSIGTSEKGGIADAIGDFPFRLAPGVSYCGFNSRKSFGG